jgi:hypothetical protein
MYLSFHHGNNRWMVSFLSEQQAFRLQMAVLGGTSAGQYSAAHPYSPSE